MLNIAFFRLEYSCKTPVYYKNNIYNFDITSC